MLDYIACFKMLKKSEKQTINVTTQSISWKIYELIIRKTV
jgi:hypothetical protein